MRYLILFLGLVVTAAAQRPETVAGWLATLNAIERRLDDPAAAAASLEALRAEIGRDGGPAAAAPADRSAAAVGAAIAAQRQALERLRGIFDLGRIEMRVTAEGPAVPTAVTVDEADFRARNAKVVPDALHLVPGVSVQRIGPRNERGVFVRGFDVRQVPLYIDGIPVYVPYDGYVDLDRFLTYDISEVQVSKGFTSPLYGPNAIGGAVNLISKAPAKPIEGDLGAGYGSGDQVHGFVNLGTRWKQFWAQGGFAWLSSNGYPLSGDFRPVAAQPAGDRLNAYQSDSKGRIRLGWTPNAGDQYTFTYAKQNGEKGNPVYAGADPAVRARYWQWPQWDKESFYFIGNKSLGTESYVKARLYYDRFDNVIYAYDDARYATQTRASSFISPYDDDTYGTTVEAGTRSLKRQVMKASIYFKDDTHREGNLGEPVRAFRGQSMSFGWEDTVRLTGRTSAVLGFSADHLGVRNAENYANGAVLPFDKSDVWAYNPQAGLFHALGESGKLHVTFARKTRLPTIKDRYSYRMGTAIPNPALREERSNNYEVGYSHYFARNTIIDAALFRSDVSNSTQRYYVASNVYQLRNLGEARYLGAEFGIRSQPVRALQLTANYTYLSRRNQSDPSLILVDTPRHKTYSSATWTVFPRFTLMADLLYEGGRWNQNDAGSYRLASRYATVGLAGTARLWRQTEIQAGVQNLFDRNYFLVDGYPEAGRTAYVNLRYRF